MSQAHIPVLLGEVMEALAIHPEGTYLDATFGRGGHSRAILERLGPAGRLFALDRDPQAVAAGQGWADSRFTIIHAPFSDMADALAERGVAGMDGILMDLGVSSPQLDAPERGFSFRFDAPLDMRMDTSRGTSAAEWLEQADEAEIAQIVRDFGEERFAKRIARTLVAARNLSPITTTGQLARLVAGAVRTRERGQDPATRTFQAIRIHINRELEELVAALPQAVGLLKPGGRLAVISFHSLEDRLVKRFLREQASGPQIPSDIPLPADQLPTGSLRLVGKAMRPGAAEAAANPRARSAVLRVAEKLDAGQATC